MLRCLLITIVVGFVALRSLPTGSAWAQCGPTPVPVDPDTIGGFDTPWYSRDLVVDAPHAYVADGSTGLIVLDVSDTANPQQLGIYQAPTTPQDETPPFTSDVVLVGTLAFIANGLDGIRVVDVAKRDAPVGIGHYQTAAYARGVAVANGVAYVAQSDPDPRGRNNRYCLIDVSSPATPMFVGDVSLPAFPIGSVVRGGLAYVAGGPGGFHIVDVSNPAAPVLRGSFVTPDYARGVALSGDRAFVATATSGLYVVDVSDPTAPVYVADHDTPDYAFGIWLADSHVLVADDENGVVIFDVESPTAPVLRYTVDTPGEAIGVTVCGDHAYVSDGGAGMRIVELVSVPTAVLIADFRAELRAGAIRLDWVITSGDGLEQVRIYRADGPVATYAMLESAPARLGASGFDDTTFEPGRAYRYRLGVTDRDGEFFSVPRTVRVPPGRAWLGVNVPNPFVVETVIRFEVPAQGVVRLDVYDVTGQRVRTIVDRALGPGGHRVAWDGRDRVGRPVPAGTYFYRLRAPGVDLTRKALRLK